MKRMLISLSALSVLLVASPSQAADPAYNAGADTIPASARPDGEAAATSALIAIYDNIATSPAYFYRGQAGYEAIDDLHGTRAGVLTALAFQYYEPDAAAPPFSATVKVYANPGGRDDTAYLVGGPYVVSGLTPGVHTAELPSIEGGPVVGPDLWVGVQFSSVTAGLAINEAPALGTSHDLYLQGGYFFYFGGQPKANFGVRVSVRKPVNAQRDLYAVDEDQVLHVDAPGVLANDAEDAGAGLTASLDLDPSHGALTLNPDGSFTYTPAPDFNGVDSLIYTATRDPDITSTATVHITVNAVNDAPVARDTSLTVDEDGVLTGNLLLNVYDVDGDALAFAPASGPAHGALDLLPGGAFTYTPAPDFYGEDAFTYTASDGQAVSNTATVMMVVRPANDPPVAVNDTATVGSGRATTLNLLANDTDTEGDPLWVDAVTTPAHGMAEIAGDSVVVYTSMLHYVGDDSFTYTVTDGNGGYATATVNINVIYTNTPPVAVCAPATVWADDQCRGTASIDAGSYDPDGDPITIDQQPAGPYGLGATQVMLVVTDPGGEADTCQQVVTVLDRTLPRITCTVSPVPREKKRGSSRVHADEGETHGRVKYLKDTFRIEYAATDNCGPVTVSAMIDAGCLQFPIESGHVVRVKCRDRHDRHDCHVRPRVDRHGVTVIEHATMAVLVVRATDGSGNMAVWRRDLCPHHRDPCDDPRLAQLTLRHLGASSAYVSVLDDDGVALFEGTVAPAAEFTFAAAEPGMTMGAEVQVLTDRNLNAMFPPECSTPITAGLVVGDFEVVTGQLLGGDGLTPLDPLPRLAQPGAGSPTEVSRLETSLSVLSAPSEATARIGFTVPAAVPVRLSIYDVRGRLVRALVNGVQPAGRHTVAWETAGVPSGVYFCRLQAGALTKRAKLLVVH